MIAWADKDETTIRVWGRIPSVQLKQYSRIISLHDFLVLEYVQKGNQVTVVIEIV